MDTATIKENTPRYSGSRPATATAASTKTSSSGIVLIIKLLFNNKILWIMESNFNYLKAWRHQRVEALPNQIQCQMPQEGRL